jgi:hypothetical protein
MADLFAGVFLGCPGTIGGKKGCLFYAMTPTFKRGGCITSDWLVYRAKDRNEEVEEAYTNTEKHKGLSLVNKAPA